MIGFGSMAAFEAIQMQIDWDTIVQQAFDALYLIIAVIIILLIGYLIGYLAKKATVYALRKTIDPALAKTEMGKSMQQSGIDISLLIGNLVLVFILSVAFIVAVDYLNLSGEAGGIIGEIAMYLPRLIGGVIVLTVGIILVGVLAKYIETLLTGVFDIKYRELSKLISSLILIGLVAFVITMGLNLMLLEGDLVYPLILGTVIIGAGAIIGGTMIDLLTAEHKSFEEAAPYAKFVIYLIFITLGAAAIFSQYPETLMVLQTLTWGLAIAMAIIMIPLLVKLIKAELPKKEEKKRK